MPSDSWLHKLHPFNKLSYILLIGLTAFAGPGGLWFPLVAALANSAVAGCSGIFIPFWKLFWRTLLPLAACMLAIHGLLNPANHTLLFTWKTVGFYREGALYAVKTLLQLAAVFSSSLLFVYSTHPADLVAALQRAGWQPGIVHLFSSPLLLLPAMRERIRSIRDAQAARGLPTDGNIRQRIRSLFPLLAPLVLGAFVEIEERSVALDIRGFNLPGKKTLWRDVPDSVGQRVGRWLMFLSSLVLLPFWLLFS